MVDVEASAVLDHDWKGEETAVVERVGIKRVSDVGFVSGETPLILKKEIEAKRTFFVLPFVCTIWITIFFSM